MKRTSKQLNITAPVEKVVERFLKELNDWWPREYTGSRLENIQWHRLTCAIEFNNYIQI
ncbi:hypothetical protein BDE36_1406 [Arcticibacter tournemirensis]|nr:hypothetical protein BDE36_1406 [Arcticibacter tournemirensis]